MENENSNSGYFSVPVTRMKLEGNSTSDISRFLFKRALALFYRIKFLLVFLQFLFLKQEQILPK